VLRMSANGTLAGGGELGARMRSIDWSKTSLGPVSSWPQSLKTCIRIVLTSRQPMFVWWGEELLNLYNDAYMSILGGKHPHALGRPAAEVWREVWHQAGPRAAAAMRGNEGTYDEALLLIMERNGYPEETYYTFSYSPVPNDEGGIGGLICANTDDTQRIVGERQLALLREQAARTSHARTLEEVCVETAAALRTNAKDVPFALLYLAEEDRRALTLAATSGIARDHVAAPARVVLDEPSIWPVGEALKSKSPRLVQLDDSYGALPVGAWTQPPSKALVIPIAGSGESGRPAVLIVGLNPFRLFDAGYEGFLGLVAGQLAASLASAQAAEEEKKRLDALAEIDRAKTAFFSNVSHEFRTPLTLMLGPIEDMRAAGAGDAEDRERIELLHRNALRLLKLVNTLLEFSRIEAGRIEAAYEPTDLAALTADLASTFRATVERAGLAYHVEASALGEPVYVDRGMWEKIVLNLLSNAFKFTFEGSISVRMRAIDGSVELDVVDTGVGIPAAELPRLFERFHRIEGARSRSHEGSGIGLALVHELVRMHGGHIDVRSTESAGTTFTVRIPCGSAHLPADRIRAERALEPPATAASAYVEEASRWTGQASTTTASTLPRVRIVVADDNADMREYVSRLLREHWYVEAFSDGREALDAIRRNPPDLVVSDVMMPNLDGFGLLRALREDASLRDTPIILLSARTGEEAVSEGITAGADDYLVKPFTARELLVRVAARLSAASGARELREQRANLYRTFMQAPFPIAIFRGADHVIEAINNVALELWNRGPEVIGMPVLDAMPELRSQPFPALLDHVYRSASTHICREDRVRIASGPGGALEDRFFNYVYAPVLDSAGQPEGIMVCAFEVTEQVRNREALKAASTHLEATNRAKDEFLATMSHELRTPLNAILGWATMLKRDHHDEVKVERGLSVIERNAKTQTHLVNDLLDVSRIITGKLRLSMKKTLLSSVIHAAADAVRHGAEAKGVRLVLDLDPDLGTTVGDPDRLQQIVWNLLSNAIKFTPPGGRVTLTAHRSEAERGMTVAVEDTGAGIPAEHLPHIFERFRQVDSSTSRAHGGLGLGLAIVRHLVDAHGGTVSAKSAGLGHGSTFTVSLPIPAVDISSMPPAEAETAAQAEPNADMTDLTPPPTRRRPLETVRVLVVDDEADSLELVRVVLEGDGARVTTAKSAQEALGAPGPFDVIVSDIGMAEVDGYAFMRSMRSRPDAGARIPAIALTAYARAEDADRAVRAGYQEHLAKPVDPRELVETVKRWAFQPGRSASQLSS
jgi:signal transduction histidine kinase/CheY-like chemotaxis protein